MKKRCAEKAHMKKTLKMHDESSSRQKIDDDIEEGALPPYLLDRISTQRAKVLINTIKQRRKEKAGKWDAPLSKVRPVAEEEMLKVLRTGKRKTKQWKRMVTKATIWQGRVLARKQQDTALLGRCIAELKRKGLDFSLLKEVDALRRTQTLRVGTKAGAGATA